MLRALGLFAVALLATGCGSQAATSADAGGGAPAAPGPSHFARHAQNPWFPLRPGSVYVYEGTDEGEPVRDVLRITRRTKTIQGVRCTVIEDRLYERGKLAERTTDWYATADDRTVWYFGEATATLDRSGKIESREGSWQSGVDGAEAGIYMPGRPRVGQRGRQEYYKGHAEDHFTIVSLTERADTPAASSRHALLTKEYTPLEPGVIDHKIYVRGVGIAIEKSVKGGSEYLKLVSVRRG